MAIKAEELARRRRFLAGPGKRGRLSTGMDQKMILGAMALAERERVHLGRFLEGFLLERLTPEEFRWMKMAVDTVLETHVAEEET